MSKIRLSITRWGYVGVVLAALVRPVAAQSSQPAQSASLSTSAEVSAPVLAGSTPVISSGVTTDWVVQTLLANNITLKSAALSVKQAGAAKQIQDGKFPYTFQADAGLTRSASPMVGRNHDMLVTETNSVVVGSQLSKTYSSGTTATVRAEGQRYDTTRPSTLASSTNVSNSSGVGYQATVRATVSQPLLSGYGSTVNEAGIRQAGITEARTRKTYARQASELLRDSLNAYWELWYDGRAIEIQAAALELAIGQQHDADQRVSNGALSLADALKFRTQVATLTESLLNAQANEKSQALTLGQLLGTVEDADALRAAATEPDLVEFQARSTLLAKAVEQSPAIAELKETLRLAQDQLRTAGDEYRSRLDITAWAEATGLAAEHAKPAVKRLGALDAVSVYGGITYQTTLDSKRLNGAKAQADYAVRVAQANLEAAIQQVQSQTSLLLVQAEQARVSHDAASKTLAIATQQAQNERQRFALGASTPLDVQVAEDALRQAQLRVVRAQVDRVKSWQSLAHVSGELLDRYVGARNLLK